MKSMTCNQLGGACDLVFSGETFEMDSWMAARKAEFEAL